MGIRVRMSHSVRGCETRWFVVGLVATLFVREGLAKGLRSPSAASYLQRGGEYFSQGDLDRAIADYNIAITFDPNYAKAYNNRGLARWTKGEVNGAI